MDESIAAGVAAPASAALPAGGGATAVPRARRTLGRWLALGAMLGCVLDARFTLALIEGAGFREANPIMEALLRYDVRAFVAVKMLLTAGGLAVLLRYAGMRLFGALDVTHVLAGIFALYAGLVFYEVVMLAHFG